MKKRIALLMALVFAFVCAVPAVFAEEIVPDETADVVEEAIAEETLAEEHVEEEIPAEEPSEEEEEPSEEEIPATTEIEEEANLNAEEEEMELQAISSVVQEVADKITAEMLTSDREPAYAVTKNLDMSLAGDIVLPDGVTVTFESSDTSVIKNNGVVTRAIGEDKDVTVTVTVSQDGSDDAVKELDFTVLNMETALLHSNNYYYPALVNTAAVIYNNSAISDLAFDQNNSGQVSAYLYPYADGYGVAVKRLTGSGVCYFNSKMGVSDSSQTVLTHSHTINISDWGSEGTKRLDLQLYASGAAASELYAMEIYSNGTLVLRSTPGNFSRTSINKRLELNTDYKIDTVVDFENDTFNIYINGELLGDGNFPIQASLKPGINNMTYYFFRTAKDSTFVLKDTAVTGAFDLSDPQVALDMIDESCFTYTNSGKITEGFSFVVPENVTTLAELYGFDVTLTSSNTSSIAIDGYSATVTKGEDKQEVTLTVTVGNADKSVSKTFDVVVHNLAATNMIEAEVPVISDNGDNKDISVDVYCDNLKEGETEAPVYLFAVRKEKESGKIDAVSVDSTTLTIGGSDTLTASLPDGGDSYDYVVYVWDSFEGQKSLINQPPAEPADLEVTGTTSGTADLSWTRADDDRKAVSSYNIYRNGNYVGSTSSTSYTGEDLDFGDVYTFGVTAVDDSGLESEYVAETEATTKDVPTITYISAAPVDAPNATQVNSSNIECSWAGKNTYLWTAPTEADGLMCHETTLYDRVNADDSITKIHSFFHTKSPFTYIDGDTKNIVIEITYFDEKPASNTGTETISVSYQGGSASTQFKDTGFWRTKTFEITNAKFTEAALTNATKLYNMRFNSTTVGLKVYKTTVARADEFVRPAASIKMDGALILRDILVYREDGQTSYDEVNGEKCLKIESGNYLEMDVETIASNQRNVNVEITYFDEGAGSIILEYAGEEGAGMEIIRRENSGTWKTALIRLDDAKLDGSLESSFGRDVDLKLFGDGDTKIRSVRVY